MNTPRIRPYRDADQSALYDIAARTGNAGGDARALCADPDLIADVWAVPYARFAPDLAFVAEDATGAAGAYVLGTDDSAAFAKRLETDWWPALRQRVAPPRPGAADDFSDVIAAWIHEPAAVPPRLASRYPAHLHLDILPALQGQGLGRALWKRWAAAARRAGVSGVHVGVDPRNAGGAVFWAACGFHRLNWSEFEEDALVLARDL